MRSTGDTALFKESLNLPLAEFISKFAGDKSFKPKAKWELSSNPDFGDYFTTAAIHLQTPQRSAHELAVELARRMRSCTGIQYVEAAESGFVNVFVSPAIAARSLLSYAEWFNETFQPLFLHKIDSLTFTRSCDDSKLRFAYGVWKILAEVCHKLTEEPDHEFKHNELKLLTEPEEFTIILQLYEFPERVAEGFISSYLYRLAVLIRDGLCSSSGIAPYWLYDWEFSANQAPRRFLLTLCERVLRAGLLLAQTKFSLLKTKA